MTDVSRLGQAVVTEDCKRASVLENGRDIRGNDIACLTKESEDGIIGVGVDVNLDAGVFLNEVR